MRLRSRSSVLLIVFAASCGSDEPTNCCTFEPKSTLRVFNAFPSPVDVVIDGRYGVSGLAGGGVTSATLSPGGHTLVLRPTGGAPISQSITTTAGASGTVVVVRSAKGTISSAVLDDTNSVVPSGATKVRVLHLAPSAGTLQVYRTQPDYATPVSWQFPFNYQPEPTSLSAPYYQSTAGTWEIRVWQSPADSSGWSSARTRVTIPIPSGEKRTLLILESPFGGLRIEVL